ncbi:uncharacterized protein crybg2 [Lycodopsis pacificus]
MAKSSTRRSLKTLFSRSELSLDESVEKDANEREKTKFKLFKFKKKTPVNATNEIPHLLSAAEPSNAAEDSEAWVDNITAGNKSSIYGTTSRSKDKEFSYSELDLRKPKRFSSFSFGFKKRKNDQVKISKSTFGLPSAGIEEQDETPPNHSQMDLDQANTKTYFSMSQPELDTIDAFDIPSPPPVATNISESYLAFPNQSQSFVASNTQPETTERLTNGSNLFDVPAEPQKAPIATIPELHLDYPDSSEEKLDDNSHPSASTTRTETSPAVDNQTVLSLPASRPPTALDTSDRKAAVVNSVATSNGPFDNDILQQSHTDTEISLTGSTRVTSSHHQPDAPDVVDSKSQNGSEPGDGDSIPYSELTRSLSEVKSESFSLIQDNAMSVPMVPSSAPPVSGYVTSQGGDTRVTHSKRRAVLVKELVTDEASTGPVCPSPVAEKMSAARGLEVRIETRETVFTPSRQADVSDGPLSPAYLSVGSDDGSMVEIYYSAEEDSGEGSGSEEMYTVDERVGSCVVDVVKEAGLCEEFPQRGGIAERGIRKREQGEFRVVIVKMQNEGGITANDEEKEDVNSRFEVEEKCGGRRSETPEQKIEMSEFLVGSDTESREKEIETVALPQVQDEGEEELPATPVQQANMPMVCDFATPSGEPHGQGEGSEGNLTEGTVTVSRTPTAASEVFASVNQPPIAEKELADEMNSGYSSLSTKLSTNNSSPPKEDESRYRFRKLSLVSEANATEGSQDAVDFSQYSTTVTESDRTDIDPDYRWRNRFHGVSQYKPYKAESSSISDSLSYGMSDSYSSTSSSSSALSDYTAYKNLSNSSSYPEEHVTIGNRLSDMTKVSLSFDSEPAGAPKDEWRRSLVEWEEPAAPASERAGQRGRETEGEAERFQSRWDSHQLSVSGISSAHGHDAIDGLEDDDCFTGVFKATLVDLDSEPAAPPSSPPASPDDDSPNQFDMDSLVDTLRSMGPSLRPRNGSLRGAPPALISSLPPIVEDAPNPVTPASLISPTKKMEAMGNPPESLKGLYTLPSDIGLKRVSARDTRSPLELMKQSQQDQQQSGTRGLNLPPRAYVTNSLIMRNSSDSSPEELKSPMQNGNGLLLPSTPTSRLDSSILFGSHRSASIDQTSENGKAHRPLYRTSSLPDKGPSNERMSLGKKELGEPGTRTEPAGSRFERFSFLLNSSPSPSSSLTGAESPSARMSLPPLRGIGLVPSSNSPTPLLSLAGSIDLQSPFTTTDSPLSMFGQTQGMGMGMGAGTGAVASPILQRSFSSEGTMGVQQTSLFNSRHGESQFQSQFQSQDLESVRNLASKYKAFPDAYLTKEKEHGKLNPRPGKMYIFDRPGMCGQRIEVRSDVIDATPWELQETISIRVVRGGWVLYEKPNFKGEKIALDEGDIELTYPFSPEEQLQNGEKEAEEQNGETSDVPTKPARRFIIGSLRRAVRDYSVPEIALFPEENAEGKKVIFRDTSDDARIFGFPIKANSIIINAGLWLVYAHPFFQGLPRVLEVGGFSNPAAWGVEQPYVGSLHPLKVGEPRVENMSEPKLVIYDKPYFTGKSRTITTNTRDFMTRVDQQQKAFMYTVGSLKIQGGMWVGYEKEGFRGHQYLLEEGEYHDWRVWGGHDAELRSVRFIRADLTDPMMVMVEQPEEEEGEQEENTFEVTEAIPDVELFEYKTSTRSISVLSGAWIAYSHVDYSGNQYILEKGFYNNCADWGSQDSRICSVQPILLAPSDGSSTRIEIILYSEPDFQGECHNFKLNQEALSEKSLTKSCRVSGGSWVLYANKQYSGNMYVLSEGDYPNLTSMGCPPGCTIHSVKVVPMLLSVPSISLFGLECLEGREITMDTEIPNMVEEGFNNHIMSVKVNRGCWVICEHSDYRGRQFLLEPIEITNWPKFSSIQTIGSMFPVRQKHRLLRIKNKERGHFLSVQGGVEEMKSGRVVVTPEVEPMSDIWFYQDGFIKSKLSPSMSLQVMGNIEPAAKVVLWAETRQPIQTWTAQMTGLITSLTFPGCVLDVKGGKTYDKDHVVIMPEDDERPSQQWEIELL